MSLHDVFSRQIMAFHRAIIDDCNRAARPNRNDAMALRLRSNALALAKIQLAMLALTGAELPMAEREAEPWHDLEPTESLTADPRAPDSLAPDSLAPAPLAADPLAAAQLTLDPMAPDPTAPIPLTPDAMTFDPLAFDPLASDPLASAPLASDPPAFDGERVLAGDALSRFVSRPLAAGESPHEVWQKALENDPVRRQRNPVLPRPGFRSPSA
ncbi:MAG TPA: hypothetical protein VHX39_00100 [Acetobacteraceae bacterium]|nr:hypothetical protein [Acetobacteraceae bacterium]